MSVGRPSAAVASPQPELPMPKDAHLMSDTSRGLLAAARAGSSSAADEAPPKPREPAPPQPLFRTKRWVRFAKELEPPEPVYLAKGPGGHASRAVIVEDSAPVVAPAAAGAAGIGRGGGKSRPPSNRGRGSRGRGRGVGAKAGVGRKAVSFTGAGEDAQMMDVDAATKVEAVPENAVAKEMEGLEKNAEAEAIQQVAEGRVEVEKVD